MENRRRYRELFASDHIHGYKWSEWTLILVPHKHGLWFAGDIEGKKPASMRQIPRTTLPTSAAGVYEIAIEPPPPPFPGVDTRKICVYVGRARDAGSRGNNLRTRIGRYMKYGSDLCNELRFFLDANCQVYVRWAQFDQGKATDDAERLLLDEFDYAFNTQHNDAYRPVEKVVLCHGEYLFTKLKAQYDAGEEEEEASAADEEDEAIVDEAVDRIRKELTDSQQRRLVAKLNLVLKG